MAEAPVLPWYLRREGEFQPAVGTARIQDGGLVRITTSRGADGWLVTRLADVREVLADSRRFSNVIPLALASRIEGRRLTEEEMQGRAGNLLLLDPPEHTRLRKILTAAFTVRQMRRLEPRIAQIVQEHLDAMERSGAPADLVEAFALPVPSRVICALPTVLLSAGQVFGAL